MQNIKWIKLSAFIEVKHCHLLFREIKEIQKLLAEYKIVGYSIELNYFQGFNIRISILAGTEYVRDVAIVFEKQILSFFNRMDLKPKYSNSKEDLFMNFYINSLHYGIFDHDRNDSYSDIELETNISSIIIDALSEEEIENDMFLTLAYYMHMVSIKIYLDVYCLPISKRLLNSYSDIYADTKIDMELISSKFLDNKLMLEEIKSDILHNKAQIDIPWIVRLENTFSKEFLSRRYDNLYINKKFDSLWCLPEKINKHLGLENERKQILNYFIFHTLSEHTYLKNPFYAS